MAQPPDPPPPEDLEFAQYDEAPPDEAALLLSQALRSWEAAESSGHSIGHYTLLEKLGDGGFGSVWRAEQTEPVKREVALKIIKLGMDTLEVMKRFEQERAALELMDHPNIARVLDAGTTPEGRPFFVMELVRGVPITEYCLRKELSVEQRLALFKAVCGGVQHAHQKGIIHRDLKPTNILVSESEDAATPGIPKIIDFGIAKAVTGEKLTALTLVTRREQMIGTPLYMSPEQAAGNPDIDTRSDIYALGVLLYELLTGQPPFDAHTLLAKGHEEMRRIIREVEPPRPSTRIRSLEQGRDRSPSTPGFTPRLSLSHDLDLITLRALEKDRARRYESATAFSEDIQRFLDHEPVRARAPSVAYLTQRWMRRHRAAAAAAIISLAAILGGAAAAVWQAARATKAQHAAEASAQEAQRQSADADAATKMLLQTVTDITPFRAGRAFSREHLSAELLARIEAFSGDPLRKARLLNYMADNVSWEDALRVHEEVLKLATPALDSDDPTLWAFRHDAAQRKTLGNATRAEGMAELRPIMEWARAHLGPAHDFTLRATHTLAHNLIADAPAEARDLLAEVNRLAALRPQHYLRAGLFYRQDYALALLACGDRDQALALGRQNVKAALHGLGESHFETGRTLEGYATLCDSAGLLKESAAASRQALEVFWRTVGPNHRESNRSLDHLIQVQTRLGDTEGLLTTHRDSVRTCREQLGTSHALTLKQVRGWIDALNAAGRPAEAGDLIEELTQGTKPHASQDMSLISEDILRPQIGLLRRLPDYPRAERALRTLIAFMIKTRPDDLQRYGDQSNLADVLMKQGKFAEALPLLKESVQVLEERGAENEKVTKTHLEQARRRLAEAQQGIAGKPG